MQCVHQFFATRGLHDSTVKLWDMRKFRKPLRTFSGVHARYGQESLAIRGNVLVAGSVVDERGKDAPQGELLFFDTRKDGPAEYRVSVGKGVSPICVRWAPDTNQIAAGLSVGSTRVL